MTLTADPRGSAALNPDDDALVARSAMLCELAQTVRARAVEAQAAARRSCDRARAVCAESRALRQRYVTMLCSWRGDSAVRSFAVSGTLRTEPVWARWGLGWVVGDPVLLAQAQYLVEHGAVFSNEGRPIHVEATLTGPPAAVMLTLAHACDSVQRIDFEPVAHAQSGSTRNEVA